MPSLRRAAVRVLHALPPLGCLCLLAASRWYPGGSSWNLQTEGASFLDTFLCDLMASQALNGAPNPVGSTFGRAGMALFILALVPAWWLVGSPTGNASDGTPSDPVPARARASRWFGLLGLIPLAGGLAVPNARLHTVAIPAAGLLELVALGMSTSGIRLPPRPHEIVGVVLVIVLLVGLGFYWPTIWYGELAHRGLPAIQKVGVVVLTVWMLLVARRAQAP